MTVSATPGAKVEPPRALPGQVGRYRIDSVVGAGAMGVVYRARDPELERLVAIKVVRAGRGGATGDRLLREALALARLRHPNVVPIFDVGSIDDRVFLVMPLMEGGTLRSWLAGGARPCGQVLEQFAAAGRGLAAAHAAGLVHRDFKPENVLLGAGGEVQVADFGLACLADDRADVTQASALAAGTVTRTGDVLGTPAYMAPEQRRGHPSDPRGDQFSFCVALWEGLYGARPFDADAPSDAIAARLSALAVPGGTPDRPAWLGRAIARGLHPDPAERWPSVAALLDAIAARPPPRWPRALALIAGLVSLSLAGLAWRATRAPAPAALRLVQLTHRGDLTSVALSPDGRTLATVARGALLVRPTAGDAADRVVVAHGIADASIAWSPDGTRLLVTMDGPTGRRLAVVAVRDGAVARLPIAGLAVFASDTELAVAAGRGIEIVALAAPTAPIRRCELAGPVAYLLELASAGDRALLAIRSHDGRDTLEILDRACRPRATYASERVTSVAASDTGTVVALVHHAGFAELVELSLDGVVASRRRVSGDLEAVLGRRRGVDYVVALTLRTHLVRLHGAAPPVELLALNGAATFALASDDETVAWIEHDGRARPRGPLRLGRLGELALGGRAVLDDAVMVSWSPDGHELAVVVDDDAGIAIVVVDRATGQRQRLPLAQVDGYAQPVWLGDRIVAAQTTDRATYRWVDLATGAQGDVVARGADTIYWLARSPRDGTLATWRKPRDGAAPQLWLAPSGGPAHPLALATSATYVMPDWTPTGELLIHALETGAIGRVAPATGEVTPIAQVAPISLTNGYPEHLIALGDGDLLSTDVEVALNVSAVAAE